MRSSRTWRKTLSIVAVLAIAIVVLYFAFGLVDRLIDKAGGSPSSTASADSISSQGTDSAVFSGTEDDPETAYAYADGQWYLSKTSLTTILVMGIDRDESGSRETHQQADFLALLVLDDADRTLSILHLNRDTMTDVIRLTSDGRKAGTVYRQLTLAHTFGINDKQRCRNTVETVQKMLFDIPIDHYLSMTMDGVAILNDSVGGVTLTLMDDFTHLNPAYTAGSVVTLRGEEALSYVQSRNNLTEEDKRTNLHRMERQRQYLGVLFSAFKNKMASSGTFFDSTLLSLGSYLVSDMTLDQMSSFAGKFSEYSFPGEMLTIAGETEVNTYMEFHMDNDDALRVVLSLFYDPCDDPRANG